MSIKFSIGQSYPIFWNSNFLPLLVKKTKNEGDQKSFVSLIKIVRAHCHNCILGVKWLSGCSEEGDHEVYSICYILRKNTHKNFFQKLQKHFFSLRSSIPHDNIVFDFQFFYDVKAKGSSTLEKFVWGFHFLFHLGFTKVYFYFEGVSKNWESVKKGKSIFFN